MRPHDTIDRDELLSALGRAPSDATLEWFGITRRQFDRWKTKPSIRVPVALGRLIRYRQRFHLAEILGKEWEGFVAHGPALEFPGLNRALQVRELRDMWFLMQQLNFHRHQAARQEIELQQATDAQEAAERLAEFYRRQLRLESGLGMMLARVAA